MYAVQFFSAQDSKKDLVMLDFEGVLKYFRVYMPKKYLDEAQCEKLLNIAYNMKVLYQFFLQFPVNSIKTL